MLNARLCRIHRLFAIAYGSLLALLVMLAVARPSDRGAAEPLIFFGLLLGPMFTVHLASWWGGSRGAGWSRWLSRAVGVALLFAVPIGTVVGYFLLKYTGESWETTARG